MTERLKQQHHLTHGFNDLQQLIDNHNAIKKKLRANGRRLKTLEIKYSFLNDITSVGGHDTLIETATKRLFKEAGFVDVRHLQNAKPKREDLQIWCKDSLILVECKGTYRQIPDDKELGQVKKYIDHRTNIIKSKLPVFGLTVINHDNRKQASKRNKRPIDKCKEDYAKAGQYGILTTIELVKGFVLLKNSKITFQQFKDTIKQCGLITFGVGADKP